MGSDPKTFVAYPSHPPEIGHTVEAARDHLESSLSKTHTKTWPQLDIAGSFLAQPILSAIGDADRFVADITRLNFNVVYEIGFAIGRRRQLLLVSNESITADDATSREVGIFDTLGYFRYHNASQLANRIASFTNVPLLKNDIPLRRKDPLLLILPKFKTDIEIRLVSRVKKARLAFRTFDPEEQGRMAGPLIVEEVAKSFGVAIPLLPASRADATPHNLRAAFVAGLAHALKREVMLLQAGNDPVPLDYRDLVLPFQGLSQIDDHVADFAARITERLQVDTEPVLPGTTNILSQLTIGSSSAENEFRDLGHYYIRTDEFNRARRGEVRIISGRKGSGKTALFGQLRDDIRSNRQRVVLDLRPEGFQLLKFKETVLDFLQQGTREHLITAFWEYLLFLEICHKLLQKDQEVHRHNHKLYPIYTKLKDTYIEDPFIGEGDFAERMLRLMDRISEDFAASSKRSASKSFASAPEIAELLYKHDIGRLRSLVIEYLKEKEALWILFDNLDKGWPALGVTQEDLTVFRCLVSAINKLQNDLGNKGIECRGIVFIRNDVYELLVESSSDRGKTTHVAIDWSDPNLLREVLRKRFVFSGVAQDRSFDEVWPQLCVSHINGEETSQYLIERSLMRPRALLDLFQLCRSHAVNLGKSKIDADDIRDGEEAYSTDLVTIIGFEIRDVMPEAGEVLYDFMGRPAWLSSVEFYALMGNRKLDVAAATRVRDILLWYGFLGVVRDSSEAAYIYSVKYDMKRLRALLNVKAEDEALLCINPAFWAGLEIKDRPK